MVKNMDPHWLDAWIQQWGDKMTQFAYLRTHDRELAQDIAQEAFLRLYR
jgi:DNA-directed RNA polymerase specialized sigma24 family protein